MERAPSGFPRVPAGAGSFARRNWTSLSVVVLVAVLLAVHAWWLHEMREGFPTDVDESRYIALGLNFHESLSADGISGLADAWGGQLQFGPLVPLLAVPGYAALDDSLLVAFLPHLLFFAVLVFSSYALARRLATAEIAVVVTLAVACTPVVLDLTRSYHFAIPSAALLVASTYALLASEGLSRRGWSVLWGLLLGLAALSRTISLAFIPAQLIAAGWLLIVRPGPKPARIVNLVTGVGLGTGVAATWYVQSWDTSVGYIATAGYGSGLGPGPERPILSVGYWTNEAIGALDYELYLPLGVVLLIALAIGVVLVADRLRLARGEGRLGETLLGWLKTDVAVVAFVIAEGYAALCSTRNEGIGFRLHLICLSFVLAGVALQRMPWPRVRRVLVAATVVAAVVTAVSKTNITPLSTTARADLTPLGDPYVIDGRGYGTIFAQGYPGVELTDTDRVPDWVRAWPRAYANVATRVTRLARPLGFTPVTSFATNEPRFNSPQVALAARRELGQDLYPIGVFAQADPSSETGYRDQLTSGLRPNVLITIHPAEPNFSAPAPKQRLVEAAARSLGFRRYSEVVLPDDRRVEIFWLPVSSG
jgi:hypothetical protein